jgi:hypothetical protein
MTVYIDDMYTVPMGQFRRMKMSHMIADTIEELHEFAARIGMARAWFQGDHYDVSKAKRDLAIKLGAVPISMRQCAAMVALKRQGITVALSPSHAAIFRYGCDYPLGEA